MEQLRGARRATSGRGRAAYTDVFGGPSPAVDYAEVFAGLETSCSIPFLDLPPPADGGYRDGSVLRELGLDYGEIFGGLGDVRVGDSYGELRAAPQTAVENGRVLEETDFSQIAIGFEFLPDKIEDHPEGSSQDQPISNFYHSDDDSTEFNMLFQRGSQGCIEDDASMVIDGSEVHSLPESSIFSDANYLKHNEEGRLTCTLTNNFNLQADSNVGTAKATDDTCPPTSPVSSTGSSFTSQKDQTSFVSNGPSVDVLSHERHDSPTSSYHSTSSGDISYSNIMYVTMSEISLRTQPLQVPPPTRPPPNPINGNANPTRKTVNADLRDDMEDTIVFRNPSHHQTKYGRSLAKGHSIQRNAKSISFCDIEIDATYSAAASAAAMKEAMQMAEARLKSAKELMERKKDNIQGLRKFDNQSSTKYKEGHRDTTSKGINNLKDEMFQGILVNEDQNMNPAGMLQQKSLANGTIDSVEKEQSYNMGHQAAICEGKERQADKGPQHTIQKNEVKYFQSQHDTVGENGEWKKDGQFYELIKNDDRKFKAGKEAADLNGIGKKIKATAKASEDKENDIKVPKRNRKLWELNGVFEVEVKGKILSAGIDSNSEKEIKEIPSSSPKAHMQKECADDVIMDSDSCNHEDNNVKTKMAQVNLIHEDEVEFGFIEETSSCGKIKNNPESSIKDYGDDLVSGEEVEERSSHAAVFCDCDIHEKEVHENFINIEPHVVEVNNKQSSGSNMNDTESKSSEQSSDFCVSKTMKQLNAEEKMIAKKVAEESEVVEKTNKFTEAGCSFSEIVESVFALEEKNMCINGLSDLPTWVEIEKTRDANSGDFHLKEDVKKIKELENGLGLGHADWEKKVVVTKESCWDDKNRNRNEEQIAVEHDGEQQEIIRVVLNNEVSEIKLNVVGEDNTLETAQEHCKNEEIYTKNKSEIRCNFLHEGKNFQSVEKEDMEPLCNDNHLERKIDTGASIVDSIGCSNTTASTGKILTEKSNMESQQVDEQKREYESARVKRQEEEQEKKIEEQKEREKEREKDKLAVERATREAYERARAEARERAERIAVERVTAEARQRALVEAREKAEKASAEAFGRSLGEKASRETKLRAERAAVERATTEARERAVERALAEKAASDARERAERSNASSRGRSNEKFGVHMESPLRRKAKLERHQRTVERAAKALEEKNLRDVLAQREQAERNRLAESLDVEIRRWSNGKEGNLRALLSTLQYILGPESGWQPISLTDVITAVAVKKAYRKATLCVHPDKLQQRGASILQKYICEKVFDLLKEAWNRFNSEER